MPPKSERLEIRLETSTLTRLDQWAAQQPDRPTRSDAVRRLIESGLGVQISDGDRLIVMMLRDLREG